MGLFPGTNGCTKNRTCAVNPCNTRGFTHTCAIHYVHEPFLIDTEASDVVTTLVGGGYRQVRHDLLHNKYI